MSGKKLPESPKSGYRILFQKSAYKEYQGLPQGIKSRADDVLLILSINPFLEILKFKKIRGKGNHYRIRIGDYRIIYTPQNDCLIVRIIRIGHRKDVYRHF
ncbi:MAG: type II toxin-antitoxin system RelE/ParE family toxin [Oligoflexia bacterium]|nr:type II toxin-antitoxin system RelE/ParE family toxin [Oligoflexia bacterium]